MKTGIYALASLTGAPLHPSDLVTLELAHGEDRSHASIAGCAVRVHDPHPGAISIARVAGILYVFAGFLDEPESLAGTLSIPGETTPAVLAAAGLSRFGKEAPAEILGEWSLLRWDSNAKELTLVTSECLRDPMFFALGKDFVAVAPDLLCLGRLPWVGLALDHQGYALNLSRAGLRHIRTEETIWKGMRTIVPGACETFRKGERISTRVTRRQHFEPWRGTFEDAAEALESVGRRIVRQHMQRQGCIAFQLSGGLDSTLLTSWGTAERGEGRKMFCISSVAPPGSGHPDESMFIRGAAATLQVPVTECWASGQGQIFCAPDRIFEEFAAPITGPYLTQEAMNAAALAGGATAVMCGSMGELHVSAGFDIPETRSWLRRGLAGMLDAQHRRQQQSGWPGRAFGPRFTPEFLAALPTSWSKVWRKGPPRDRPSKQADPPIGIGHMWYKNVNGSTSSEQGLRQFLPFRDQRLMLLAAGMPSSFLRKDGQTRPFARHLLQGKVPDAVRLREQGRAFAPDYASRLKAEAIEARSRVILFQDAGIGRWIDLPWLEAGLRRLENTKAERDTGLFYSVQTTAMNAEFLLWATSRGIKLF